MNGGESDFAAVHLFARTLQKAQDETNNEDTDDCRFCRPGPDGRSNRLLQQTSASTISIRNPAARNWQNFLIPSPAKMSLSLTGWSLAPETGSWHSPPVHIAMICKTPETNALWWWGNCCRKALRLFHAPWQRIRIPKGHSSLMLV